MPLCAACGVNMTVAEVTQRPYDGVPGNYHRDCAYVEHLLNAGPSKVDPFVSALHALTKDKLNKKHIAVAVPVPAAPAGVPVAGANLGLGAYTYAVAFVDRVGQTIPGTTVVITTTGGNLAVNLTAIPLGPASTSTVPLTIKRALYRTIVAGAQLKFLAFINDNTTTTFSDTIADGSLGANAPVVNTFAIADYP